MPRMNRRSLLAAAAGAVPIAAAAALPFPAAAAGADAELVQAFEDWRQASRDLDALPEDGPEDDPERVAVWARLDDATGRLERLPALTPAGVEAKLRRLFPLLAECAEVENAMIEGRPPHPDALRDFRFRMIWNVIQDCERMGGAHG